MWQGTLVNCSIGHEAKIVSLRIFIIKGFRTIFLIFIVISTTCRPIRQRHFWNYRTRATGPAKKTKKALCHTLTLVGHVTNTDTYTPLHKQSNTYTYARIHTHTHMHTSIYPNINTYLLKCAHTYMILTYYNTKETLSKKKKKLSFPLLWPDSDETHVKEKAHCDWFHTFPKKK